MTFTELRQKLVADFPHISFEESTHFYWSPSDKTVYYSTEALLPEHLWTLLHETAHGLLGHYDFSSDFQLILLEREAWEKTLELCESYAVSTPKHDYVEDCIDTYRNWQYRRSQCPTCDTSGVQTRNDTYTCVLCAAKWSVTKQRFCRAYRKNKTTLVP